MTGRRPGTLAIWDLPTHFRDRLPDVVTLPQHFMNHGYFTQNIGKIYHNWRQEIQGDPASWSVPAVMHFATHASDKPQVEGELPPDHASDPKCECRDVPDDAYFDGRIANLAVAALRERKVAGQPFFLAVGFWKPHSPFNAPKKYWDLYDRGTLSPPANPQWPDDAPRIAWHNSREIVGRPPARELSPQAVMELRHGYLAAISYLDAQIGRVLDELQALGLGENTIVVFWSDHGYHLGEHTLWAKTSNFENDARVPLIFSTPSLREPGVATDAIAELVDLYPTLAELCSLPAPDDIDGVSLVPALDDPSVRVKQAAYTEHPRPAYFEQQPDVMGRSVRTARFRYTEWRDFRSGELVATELYDHERDPLESVNIAAQVEYAEARAECRQWYQRGFGNSRSVTACVSRGNYSRTIAVPSFTPCRVRGIDSRRLGRSGSSWRADPAYDVGREHVNVDRPIQHDRIASQRRVDQLSTRKCPAGLANKRREETELAGSQVKRFALGEHTMATMIDHHSLARHDVVA